MDLRPENNNRIKKFGFTLLNVIEIYIPAIMLIVLFVCFIIGIVFRYIIKNPQSWTFELSSISFLQFAILSACLVQRDDEHIVFNMVYERRSARTQCAMRIFGGVIVCFTATLLIPNAIEYVHSMIGLKTQILQWPRWCVFVCFPITFIIMDIRTVVRLIQDIQSFVMGTYEKKYPRAKERVEQ